MFRSAIELAGAFVAHEVAVTGLNFSLEIGSRLQIQASPLGVAGLRSWLEVGQPAHVGTQTLRLPSRQPGTRATAHAGSRPAVSLHL